MQQPQQPPPAAATSKSTHLFYHCEHVYGWTVLQLNGSSGLFRVFVNTLFVDWLTGHWYIYISYDTLGPPLSPCKVGFLLKRCCEKKRPQLWGCVYIPLADWIIQKWVSLCVFVLYPITLNKNNRKWLIHSPAGPVSASQPSPAGGGPASTGNPLEFLRNQPQFQQMRQIIQQNPALLPALLQQLGRDNPQLLQVSMHHTVQFIYYINWSHSSKATFTQQAQVAWMWFFFLPPMWPRSDFFTIALTAKNTSNLIFAN